MRLLSYLSIFMLLVWGFSFIPSASAGNCDDVVECIEDCYADCRGETAGCGRLRNLDERRQCIAYCYMGCNNACRNCAGGTGPGNEGEDGPGSGELNDGFDPYQP